MSECGGNPENCKLCGKKGLPILLTRYAVATHETIKWYTDPTGKFSPVSMQESGAPEVKGDFVKPAIDLKDTAYYTLKLMRGGYVYVFDEKRKTWKGYFVSDEAYLAEFDIQTTFGQTAIKGQYPEKKVPCKAAQYGLLAACITVEKAEEAGNIWVAFSDVQWTEAVWKKFDKNEGGIREKQMRKFEVDKWLSSQKQTHACKLLVADQHVAEFCKDVKKETFDFSPSSFAKRWGYYDFTKYIEKYREGRTFLKGKGLEFMKPTYYENELHPYKNGIINGRVERGHLEIHEIRKVANYETPDKEVTPAVVSKMLTECYTDPIKLGINSLVNVGGLREDQRDKVAVLAIDDAPGVAMDLANLMSHRVAEFNGQSKYARKLFASISINNFRDSIYSRAEVDELERKRNIYLEQTLSKWIRTSPSELEKHCKSLTPEQKAAYDAIEPTEEELEKARQRAWLLYSKKLVGYDPPKRKYDNTGPTDAPLESEVEFRERKRVYDDEYCAKNPELLYDEETRKTFQDEYEKDLAAFDTPNILNIANAHVSWMGGTQLAEYFQSHFDPANKDSGKTYTAVFSMCIADSQDKGPCHELYTKWIESGDTKDHTNLLMRAAIMNQDELADAVKEAVAEAEKIVSDNTPTPDPKEEREKQLEKATKPENKQAEATSTELDKLFEKLGQKFLKALFKDFVSAGEAVTFKEYASLKERLKEEDQINRVLKLFYAQTIGVGTKHMMKWAESNRLTSFMFCRAGLGEARPVFVKANTTVKDFTAYLLAKSTAASAAGNAKRAADLSKLEQRLRVMQAQGVNVNKAVSATIYTEIPFDRMSPKQRAELGALITGRGRLPVTNLEALLALQGEKWDDAIAALKTQRKAEVHRMSKLGAQWVGNIGMTGYVAYTTFTSAGAALDVLKKSQTHTTAQINEALARFVASISTMLATVVESIRNTISSAVFRLKYGSGLKMAWAKWLKGAGRWLGIPGLAVSMVTDILGAIDARAKGQSGLMYARVFSAGLGLVSIVLLFTPFALIGLIVLVVSLVLSALISMWEDDPYRDWIGKCVFGKYPDGIKYSSADEEMKAFQSI